MPADIIKLAPTARQKNQPTQVTVTLTPRMHARLLRYAREWSMSPNETARYIIENYFNSIRDR